MSLNATVITSNARCRFIYNLDYPENVTRLQLLLTKNNKTEVEQVLKNKVGDSKFAITDNQGL